MATGRIDVSTAKDVLRSSLLDPESGADGTYILPLKRNLNNNGFNCRDDSRVFNELCGNGGFGSHVDFEDGEILATDEGPFQKKRKFSPISSDEEEKVNQPPLEDEVVSYKIRPLAVERDAYALDGSASGSDVSCVLGEENDGEIVAIEPRNIYSSRWASDEDYASEEDTLVSCTSNDDISGEDDVDNEFVAVELMSDDETMDEQTEEPLRSSPRNVDMCEGCRSVMNFEKLNEINEGTYGKVYRARDMNTGEIVALKKVKMSSNDKLVEEYGFPLTALREINILMSLSHPNIVNVKEVVMGDLDSVFMVMECMDYDLKGLMEVMKQPFSLSEVKCLMLQLLEGIKYLHDNWVLHRDLKTSNLLLNTKGELKVCDFGMARRYGSPMKPYTSLVVTLWYRAPELLLGAKQYSTALDMWSVGCIMAELLAKAPLFPGKSEIDQLNKIFRILGTPNEKVWPGLSSLPGAKANFAKQPFNLLRKQFPASSFMGSAALSEKGFDLLSKLLTYDPEKRITAEEALKHSWFAEAPLPTTKEFISTFPPQCTRAR